MNKLVGIDPLSQKLDKFVSDRDWDQFHTPKNLAMALSVEVAELVELFQWETQDGSCNVDMKNIEGEVADIFIYLLLFSGKYDIDIIDAAWKKIDVNNEKYPTSKSKGLCVKYDRL